MNSQALLDAITADTASHISLLQCFIRAPSPNPPGDTRLAAGVIASYLHSHNINHQVLSVKETLDNVVSDFTAPQSADGAGAPGADCGPRLIMNGHIDVFPAGNGSGWDRSPWSGDLVDGRIHGRGGVDMKAGTAASVIAYAYLYKYRAYLKPGARVGLMAVSDEETGGRWGTKWLLEQEEEEKEEEEGANIDIERTHAGNSRKKRWAGDVMITAEPGGLNTIRFAEKGTLRLTFTVDVGPGAHGAYTHLSPSATRIAARLINDLAVVEDIEPDVDPALRRHLARDDVREALDACMGAGAADISMKCTLNIGTLHGGLKVNMIPGQCIFEADIRMPLGLTRERVMSTIHGILQQKGYRDTVEVAIQEAASNPAAASPHDHPMVEILGRQATRVRRSIMSDDTEGTVMTTGGGGRGGRGGESPPKKMMKLDDVQPPVAVPSMGATDCKHYRYAGIPAYVYGGSPESMGATNESVSVEEFLVVAKTHALAAWEFLGGTM